jgi:hypothetical protein
VLRNGIPATSAASIAPLVSDKQSTNTDSPDRLFCCINLLGSKLAPLDILHLPRCDKSQNVTSNVKFGTIRGEKGFRRRAGSIIWKDSKTILKAEGFWLNRWWRTWEMYFFDELFNLSFLILFVSEQFETEEHTLAYSITSVNSSTLLAKERQAYPY